MYQHDYLPNMCSSLEQMDTFVMLHHSLSSKLHSLLEHLSCLVEVNENNSRLLTWLLQGLQGEKEAMGHAELQAALKRTTRR